MREAGCYLTDEARIKSSILEFLRLPEIAPFFTRVENRKIMNEQEFVNPDGRLFRMDRIIVDADAVTVLDFKTGDDKDAYTDQVKGIYQHSSKLLSRSYHSR